MKKKAVIGILILLLLPMAAFAAAGPLAANDEAEPGASAWDKYNKGDYQGSYDAFSRLLETRPGNEDSSLGLAYSSLKIGRLDEALKIAEAFEGRKKDFTAIKIEVYGKKGSSAFEKKDYKMASFYLGKFSDAKPEDDGIAGLLAWSLYNEGRFDEALKIFQGLYAKTNDVKFADAIMTIYGRTGESRGVYAIAGALSRGDEKQKATAAQHLFKAGCPVAAAATYNGAGECFYNANSPWLVFSPGFRYKRGDEGTSKVMESYALLGYFHPFGYGQTLGLEVTDGHFTSGTAPSMPFAGKFFKGIPQKNSLTTSVSTIGPRITFEKEAGVIYTLSAGTTPLGGEISALPVFSAAVKSQRWRFDLHQSPVDESLLSHTGLKDPYSDGKWGRVVKTGAEAAYMLDLFSKYWLSIKAGYDRYSGMNVLRNHEYGGTAAFGRTVQSGDWNASAGIFANVKGFKHNSNFFTFGNGGYFSPQSFLAVGPMVHIKTKPCLTYSIDSEFGVSYLNYRTKNAKRYPLENTGAASAEEFNGEVFSGIGYSAGVTGVKLIQKRVALGGSFKMDRSASYREWKAAAEIKFFFEPREAAAYY